MKENCSNSIDGIFSKEERPSKMPIDCNAVIMLKAYDGSCYDLCYFFLNKEDEITDAYLASKLNLSNYSVMDVVVESGDLFEGEYIDVEDDFEIDGSGYMELRDGGWIEDCECGEYIEYRKVGHLYVYLYE